jgi:hypothetical protein
MAARMAAVRLRRRRRRLRGAAGAERAGNAVEVANEQKCTYFFYQSSQYLDRGKISSIFNHLAHSRLKYENFCPYPVFTAPITLK